MWFALCTQLPLPALRIQIWIHHISEVLFHLRQGVPLLLECILLLLLNFPKRRELYTIHVQMNLDLGNENNLSLQFQECIEKDVMKLQWSDTSSQMIYSHRRTTGSILGFYLLLQDKIPNFHHFDDPLHHIQLAISVGSGLLECQYSELVKDPFQWRFKWCKSFSRGLKPNWTPCRSSWDSTKVRSFFSVHPPRIFFL